MTTYVVAYAFTFPAAAYTADIELNLTDSLKKLSKSNSIVKPSSSFSLHSAAGDDDEADFWLQVRW